MNSLLSQLHDIKGLDAIGWWPPAPGWWALVALLVAAGAVPAFVRHYRRRRALAWKTRIRAALNALEDRPAAEAKQTAAAFAELLRLIAMRRHGRAACAGLQGKAWLSWLHRHDPDNFDWPRRAAVLLDAPYAPPGAVRLPPDWNELVKAAERWVG